MPASREKGSASRIPAALLPIFNLDAGLLDAAIRSEVFGVERFVLHGVSLGLTHRVVRESNQRESFTPRLRDNIQRLRCVNAYIGTQALTGYDISPAAEWLLENFHVLEAQFQQVDEGLPATYFQGLPVLQQPPLAGLPRVYGVAWAFVAHTDSAFDKTLLILFLNAYQQSCPLRLSELWALPTTLRVVLMENLRRLADRVAANKAARELANRCCDDLDHYNLDTLEELRECLQRRGVDGVFLAQLSQRLQADVSGSRGMVKTWLQTVMPSVQAVLLQQRAEQAADNLSVSNAVNALRTIGDADWPDVVMQTNPSTRLMLRNPVFEAEHPITRNTTMHGIEKLAKRSGKPELEVTQALLQCIAGVSEQGAAASVPAYWLYGQGGGALQDALGLARAPSWAWADAARSWALPLYIGSMGLGTGLLLWWLLRYHAAAGLGPWGLACLAWVALLPASEAMVALVNRLASESLVPQPLPRLAFLQGIPPAHRVAVVIPCMLVDPPGIDALVLRLQLHYLANPESCAQFALLTDFLDAPSPTVGGDAALLDHATRALAALNQRHPFLVDASASAAGASSERPLRFVLLHRARRFSASENAWIGWERKRGKLEALVAAMAGEGFGGFVVPGALGRLAPGTPYVLTLDADTQLPPGCLRSLVGMAAHPSNQPVFDSARRAIVKGYGILQPKVLAPLPGRHARTPYHWLFAGQYGMDAYSATSSEVYQDVFGQGTFSGKGLLHVDAMHRVLGGRFPDEQVLSHDLLEGALVRCAAVTDVTLLEDPPHHPDMANARIHRWTRGDWQLLPFMLQRKRYGINGLNLWKMLDNLRRSLVAPACMLLVLLSVCGWGLAPGYAALLVVLAYTAGPLIGALAGLFPGRPHGELRFFYANAGVAFLRVLALGVWHSMQLLQQTLLALDAVVRALFRVCVSRRRLLEWTTAASVQAGNRTGLGVMLRKHGLLAVWTVLGALLLAPWVVQPVGAALWAGLWLLSPWALWGGSQSTWGQRKNVLNAASQTYLQTVARETWAFFEHCVTAQDQHLPPDNLQVMPFDTLAHRTSPTNIGLYLLSCACATQFGWLGVADLCARLQATLDTLQLLPRHRGHFFNWYDTQTLAVLTPAYVSTVDSGNLSGHLLATAQACLDFARRERASPGAGGAEHAITLDALAQRLQTLALEPEYGFLYSPQRRLFHIGYRVREQELDGAFYDLLASESRLTSLVAIAKGDVEAAHWGALGRTACLQGLHAGLRSWSGSMFEYLMPSLLLDEPHGSLLQSACTCALLAQRAFAEQHQVPWGISESAYAGRDGSLAYQYAPQGVPALALRRTPADELVVAPYATMLAVSLDPQGCVDNLQRLERLGARRSWGFIEALDYTPARQTGMEPLTLVGTFMAHHQGMTLAALSNVLQDGIVKRWGMADPHLQAVSSLLHERVPTEISQPTGVSTATERAPLLRRHPGLVRQLVPGEAAVEPTQLLSNGRYSVALRANGAGTSQWGATAISRWRDDALRDAFGSFVYCRSVEALGTPPALRYSITRNPAGDPQAQYHCSFQPDRVVLSCTAAQWQSSMTVWVSPEDDIEFRQVALHNPGDGMLELEISCCLDIALNSAQSDEAHPAFSKLFVASQWLERERALVFTRKPRVDVDPTVCATHFLAHADATVLSVQACADRQRWAGRNLRPGQDSGWSQGEQHGAAYFQAAGVGDSGLDPVAALVVRIRLGPFGKAQLTFATAAAAAPELLHALRDKYQQGNHIQRASLMSSTLAGIRLRALQISPDTLMAVQSMTTALTLVLRKVPSLAKAPLALQGAVCDKRLLWRLGVSGERPLLVVSIGVLQGLGVVRALTQSLRMWAWAGVACDLVVLNTEPASYHLTLQRELLALCERLLAEFPREDAHNAISMQVFRADSLSHQECSTLYALARLHWEADGRPLAHHVQEWMAGHHAEGLQRAAHRRRHPGGARHAPLAVQVAQGVFAASQADFSFEVRQDRRPLRPWVNVLANPGFGTVRSEAGGGYTWAGNSRLNQLTPWSNDPVADPPGEWFFLQDMDSAPRSTWSVSPDAWALPATAYTVTHGCGTSIVRHRNGALEVELRCCVDPVLAVKQLELRVHNHGPTTLHLRCIGMVEWVMGARLQDRASAVTVPHWAGGDAVLLCTQSEQAAGLGGGTAFWACSVMDRTLGVSPSLQWTCDRREFFDSSGDLVMPDTLGQRSGAGLDPCAALAIPVQVPAGQSSSHCFVMGYAADAQAALTLARQALRVQAEQRWTQVSQHWAQRLGVLTIQTPDPLMDAMVNRWLLYQTLACRLWAKAGFYQAGGATGFRDQLQDAMALVLVAPDVLRAQMLLCASRQFEAGDVQHWWHSPDGAGVRTRISDDLLWLPFALGHYLRATGDSAVLEVAVPFLTGQVLEAGQEDAYFTPDATSFQASVFEHGARALDRSLAVGAHGLPLMGCGDWNDGMNAVGRDGRGESVWLGWFLVALVRSWAPLARSRGHGVRAHRWELAAQQWLAALEGSAWDGQWYVRAFFDDGSALGSHALQECRIDLIAQAWAVLSEAASAPRAALAMQAVQTELVDPVQGLVKLLAPPLQHQLPRAGYIQNYPPGIRENGGQYSHAGVWALMAQAQLHREVGSDLPYRYFCALSPAHRSADAVRGPVYGLEPYAMAGDVYGAPPYTGRGGWSWYTGSAAWMYRAATESLFGLEYGPQCLRFRPCLPAHWGSATMQLRLPQCSLHMTFERAAADRGPALTQSDSRLLGVGNWLDYRDLVGTHHIHIAV